MPRLGTYFEIDDTHKRRHDEERLCYLESIKDAKELGRYAEVVAVCTCGRRKDYFASEAYGYVFVCNGGVIMKHNKDGLHVRGRFNPKSTP